MSSGKADDNKVVDGVENKIPKLEIKVKKRSVYNYNQSLDKIVPAELTCDKKTLERLDEETVLNIPWNLLKIPDPLKKIYEKKLDNLYEERGGDTPPAKGDGYEELLAKDFAKLMKENNGENKPESLGTKESNVKTKNEGGVYMSSNRQEDFSEDRQDEEKSEWNLLDESKLTKQKSDSYKKEAEKKVKAYVKECKKYAQDNGLEIDEYSKYSPPFSDSMFHFDPKNNFEAETFDAFFNERVDKRASMRGEWSRVLSNIDNHQQQPFKRRKLDPDNTSGQLKEEKIYKGQSYFEKIDEERRKKHAKGRDGYEG
ncbi:hypothetical protein N9W34_01085 [Rickettsiales bacterium]|nr:hypothetical protein [Rickettsiales bacterium]